MSSSVSEAKPSANVKQAVPFFMVTDMERSHRFYTEGLGFERKISWTPDGKLRWCWLERGGAALMLQEYRPELRPQVQVGVGVSIAFICEDAVALYREFTARGVAASEPQVGNEMWVTSLVDPDGYNIAFESMTDVPEETTLSQWEAQQK